MVGVAVGPEGIDPDQDVTGADQGKEVVVGTVEAEANPKITDEEAGENQDRGQDIGAKKKERALTRPTQFSRKYQVIIALKSSLQSPPIFLISPI